MGDVKVLSFPDYSSQQSRNRALGFLASADLGKSQLLMTGLTSEADSTHFTNFLDYLVPNSSYSLNIKIIEAPWTPAGDTFLKDFELIVVVSKSISKRRHLKVARDYCADFPIIVPLMILCP